MSARRRYQDKVGADPTGLPFNSVIALELHGGKPLSPLVNAGAIATTSLLTLKILNNAGSEFYISNNNWLVSR